MSSSSREAVSARKPGDSGAESLGCPRATFVGRYGRYLQDQGYEIEFKKEQLISGVCHEGLLVRVPAAGGA